MATDVLLIRQGKGLVACDPISHENLASIAQGEQVVATIRRARNPKHHRKMFALLNEVYKNQDFYATLEGMLDDIKIAVGHCRKEPSKTAPGGYRMVPKSISFANMGQTAFEQFYNKAVEFILSDVLPGMEKDDLERRVLEIIDQDC